MFMLKFKLVALCVRVLRRVCKVKWVDTSLRDANEPLFRHWR